MATKSKPAAPAKSTAVTVKKSGAVGAPINAAEILKQAAMRGRQEVSKAPSSDANALSFRNGTISYQGREIGHTMKVIIVHPQFERTYYDRPFDPDKPVPPLCYSFDNEKPHADASEPQHATCTGCKWNAFKTDERQRGKACKEGLRVALLPGDRIDADVLAAAPLISAKFSVLNSMSASSYMEMLYETVTHPSAVVTELSCNPDPRRQVVNDFEQGETLDGDALTAVAARIDDAVALLAQPYPPMDESMKRASPAQQRKGPRRF